jgi:hypothetical protein
MLLARCYQIIWAFGTFDPPDLSLPLQAIWEAFEIYRELGDIPNMARCIDSYGNNWRLVNREDIAASYARRALHLLRGHFDDLDPRISHELHNTLSWNLKFWKRLRYGVGELERDVLLFTKLGRESDDPGIRFDTHRVLIGFWLSRNNLDLAFEEVEKLHTLRVSCTLPPYAEPSIDRGEIEAWMQAGAPADFAVAGRLIESRYLAHYRRDRHLWSFKTLQLWMLKPKLNLSVQLEEPRYSSGNLTFLPRLHNPAA